MKPLKRLYRLYASMTIGRKLMLSFLTIVLCCILFMTAVFFINTSEIVSENAVSSFTEVINQCSSSLDNLFASTESAVKAYQYNETLVNIMRKDDPYPLSEQLDDHKYLNQIQMINTANYRLDSICFYRQQQRYIYP